MSEFWDNIDDHSGTDGGEYFTEGEFFVKIIRCKEIDTAGDGFKGAHAFVAECEVLESDSEKTKVGSHPALFVDMESDWPKLAKGNIADFMRAGLASVAEAMGEEAEKDENGRVIISKELAMMIKGEDNILAGAFLTVRCWIKITKKKKVPFTMHEWNGTDLQELRAKYQ